MTAAWGIEPGVGRKTEGIIALGGFRLGLGRWTARNDKGRGGPPYARRGGRAVVARRGV